MNNATLTRSTPQTKLEFVWLELTEKCNLSCIHCYADSGPNRPLSRSMSYSDWCRVIDDAQEMGCKKIQLIGGEVHLVPYLEDLIIHARSAGFDLIEVYTNATLLNSSSLAFFVQHKIEIATSLYCDQAHIHDEITQRPGSWAKTVTAIQRITQAGLTLRVAVIEMEKNRDRTNQTLQFVQNLGVKNVGIDHARSVGRGSNLTNAPTSLSALCGHCGGGRVCVSSSGEIFPCIMARDHVLGSVHHDGLRAAYNTSKRSEFRSQLLAALKVSPSREGACSPGCWPHGGCAPHDICLPDLCKPLK